MACGVGVRHCKKLVSWWHFFLVGSSKRGFITVSHSLYSVFQESTLANSRVDSSAIISLWRMFFVRPLTWPHSFASIEDNLFLFIMDLSIRSLNIRLELSLCTVGFLKCSLFRYDLIITLYAGLMSFGHSSLPLLSFFNTHMNRNAAVINKHERYTLNL